jgi:transposase
MGVLMAKHSFSGTCNTDVFIDWLKIHLLPNLTSGYVLVMDNASFHKSKAIIEVVEAAGCRVKYLPPYSPDLNPIERAWFPLKNNIRKNMRTAVSLMEAVELELL